MLLFLIILSLICTLSCISAAECDSNSIGDSTSGDLSEIHVSPDASDITGDGSLKKPFKSVGYAVNASKNGATIYLNDGKYLGDDNRNIEIDKSLTIIGKSKQNTIIDGESCARIFNVTSAGRLTLINITFMNSHATGNGGMIYAEGGEINIKNCIVINSSSDADGGVIYNNMGTLNIENSCFANNSAYEHAGVLYTMGTTVIKNTNFTENVLISKWGVGACIVAGGKLDLDGCLFYKCFTTYAAAGILNYANATVNNCRFERLSTEYTAGGISNHYYMIINNSYFGYNEVQYYAAAILAPPSGQHVVTEVYNTIFERNHASFHGAVSNNFKDTDLLIKNSAIVDNYLQWNRAYGDFALDENATIQYCWWGKNTINPYYYSPHDGVKKPEKINASRWLIMTFTADNDVIYTNDVNKLTVSLKQYFDNETKEIYRYDEDFNLPLEVTFYTDSGTLATKKLVNGVATFDFTPKSGVSAVYAKINNQVLKLDNFQSKNITKTTPKLTANEKTFKSNDESKKYTVTLKDVNGKAIANAAVTLKVGGATYSAKTNSNGVATFNLKKLTKVGTFDATVTYPGSDSFNKVTSNAKITVKSVWKTVSKSSKDKAMVKKIQKALKKNGYYIKYKGHYLKVDGIFQDCTVRAVKQFQKANGLKVTGKVDYRTAQKLKLVK
ncbi:MAG: peptidoglycan-binding protein [Methanobrevibacter sp.]|uniref:peptidoglycan-binding protein n=1 Tax=Methanobrevibacter sp. TaxID=66852 RepID=UPI0025E72FBA|nr:peptidoglycan-binding protein [Methanobrevibacter sp.]MBQ6100560.1 peptidoglycan-binding protein [Methanobrevibacter sp.]